MAAVAVVVPETIEFHGAPEQYGTFHSVPTLRNLQYGQDFSSQGEENEDGTQ